MSISEYLASIRRAIERLDTYGFAESIIFQEEIRAGKPVTCGGMTVLKEPHSPYNTLSGSKKVALSHKNTYYIELTCRK